MIERLRYTHVEAVRIGAPLTQCDGSTRDRNRLLEFGSRNQHVAQIQKGRHQVGMLRSEVRLLGGERAPGQGERLVVGCATVQDQSAHQNVRGRRHFGRVVPVRGSQLLDLISSRAFGLLVLTCGKQARTSGRTVFGGACPAEKSEG